MLRSSFSKYLLAFTAIIVVSFLLMSGIISAMLSDHIEEDKREKLRNISSIAAENVADHIKDKEAAADSFGEMKYLLRIEREIIIIITESTPDGERVKLFFDAEHATVQNDMSGTLINFKEFQLDRTEKGDFLFKEKGVIDGITSTSSKYCAKAINVDGKDLGYAVAVLSNERDDAVMTTAKKAMLNGTLWVLLAAIIAVYFITERIVHPLRDMTGVVKCYSKGDFSQRVVVHGKDEVAELGIAFNNMASSLENLERMRNSFLANVSHDLRTPMTTIAGFIDGITSGAIPPYKQEYYLGVISDEVHRLSRLVSQLLDVSRLESGDRKFNFTDFDIAELSRIVLISFESKIEEKRLDVQFISDDDSMPVHADKDAIHQVLYNLCHNAMKFSREGGRFEIKITRVADKKIKVTVYNEGQGIPAVDLPMVFDRFYKTDESRGLDKNGVGLGLYISKTIIDAHGEKIGAESVENEYCSFSFTLPEGEKLGRRQSRQITGDIDEGV